MHFEPLDRPDRQKLEILQIQDGGGRHLENRKIAISQPRFERFRQNLVRWCSSTLLGAPTVKKIKNPQDGGGRYLEKLKNRHISAAVEPILTQFGTMMHFEPLDRPDGQKFKFCKSKMAAAAISKIEK